MKYFKIFSCLLLIMIFACDDDKIIPNDNTNPIFKKAQDSVGLINIEVDSSFIDSVEIIITEDTVIFN